MKEEGIKAKEKSLESKELAFASDKTRVMKEAFLHAVAVNTALSHLPDVDFSFDSKGERQFLFRADVNMPEDLLKERTRLGQEMRVGFELGFFSTRKGRPDESFLQLHPNCVTILDGGTGKNIAPLSDYPEGETLIASGGQFKGVSVKTVLRRSATGEPPKEITIMHVRPVRVPREDPVGPPRLKGPEDVRRPRLAP